MVIDTRPKVAVPEQPKSEKVSAFCDSCLDGAHDEASGMFDDVDLDFQEDILGMMGADIADHLCDGDETGQSCACPGHGNSLSL
jgi:hypothetical protein